MDCAFGFYFLEQVFFNTPKHANNLSCLGTFKGYRSPGSAIDFVCEHAVNVHFALGLLNWKFGFKPAATTAYYGAALFPKNLHANCFFSAPWAGEELW
jgi:hypothetical protein